MPLRFVNKSDRRRQREILEKRRNSIQNEDSDSDEGLGDYERKRLQNIVDRKNKIDELKLLEKKSELSAEEKERRKRMLKEKLPSGPPRKSMRKQNLDPVTGLKNEPIYYLANKSYTKYGKNWKRQYNTGDHHFVFGDDPPRLPVEDLKLEDLCESKETCETISNYFDHKVKPILNEDPNVKESKSIFDNIETLGQNLEKLKITEETVAQVMPFRIFSLAVHPTESKLLVAAGDKWGSIGFWDVLDRKSETKGIQVIKPHSRPVNCLTFDFFDNSKLVSTSFDGTMRIFDINEKMSSTLYARPEDKSSYTTYHVQVDRDCYLVTLGGPGALGLIDRRSSNMKAVSQMKVCDVVSPKMVNVHPTKTNVVFMAPIDQGCGIFDLRKQVKRCRGDQAVNSIKPLVKLATRLGDEHAAVSSAFFSTLTGNKVVTVSFDDRIKLFDTSNDSLSKHYGKNLKPYRIINHFTKTNKTTTSIKAEWHPRRDDIFLLGSRYYAPKYGIDIMSDQGNYLTLADKRLKSQCSIVKCHPTQDFIVGADSYGKIHVFME